MKIIPLTQGTVEWEEFRRSHIGASDIGILMEGTEREIYDLLQEKRGLHKKFVTKAMQHGTDTEAEAIEWLMGVPSTDETKLTAVSRKHEWLMASFDYIDLELKILAEIKCPKVVLGSLPQHPNYKKWWWQVQAQLCVSNLKEGYLLAYSSLNQARETVGRDEKAIAQLIKKGEWFYNLMINFESLPSPSELPAKDDDKTSEWADYYRLLDEKIKELEEHKKILREEGIALANEESFQCKGVKVQKVQNKESFDWEGACKANGIDMSKYTKSPKSPFTWRITAG